MNLLKKRFNITLAITGFFILVALSFSAFAQHDEFSPFKTENTKISFTFAWIDLKSETGAKSNFSIIAEVPAGHHAYMNKGEKGFFIPIEFDFNGVSSKNYQVSPVSSPTGEKDEVFNAIVLRGTGEYVFSIEGGTAITKGVMPPVVANFQICNDKTKICYPPDSAKIYFFKEDSNILSPLPKVEAEDIKTAPLSVKVNQEQKIVSTGVTEKISLTFKKYSNNIYLSFFIILVAGLLAAGTPCVYPMLPITCAILMERGKGDKKMGAYHTLIYFSGIVFVYMSLGFIAGITGGAFNAIMKSAAVNLFFALFFVIFGLAMLDYFKFSFGEDLMARISSAAGERKSLTATFVMGLTAGLIISPCVGPVVFTLLLNVADRMAESNALLASSGEEFSFFRKSLIAGEGGLLMAGFGIGIGMPFLLIGFFSNKLPRSGMWMVYIKNGFGVVILYVAWVYYMKGIATAKISDQAANAIFAGIMTLLISLKLGLLRPVEKPFKRILSLLTFTAAIALGYYGFLIHSKNAVQTESQSEASKFEIHGNLSWHRYYEAAKREAQREMKPIFVDFYADWCANCIEFGKLSEKDRKLNEGLKKAVLLKIYDTDPVFKFFQNNQDHRELKTGLPYFAILKPDGTLFWKGTQYDAIDTMIENIDLAIASLRKENK